MTAGADIKEMSELSFMDCYKTDMFEPWQEVAATSKPVIAAVNGQHLAALNPLSPWLLQGMPWVVAANSL